jgi:hypothetical protein
MNFYAHISAAFLCGMFLTQPVAAQTFKISCELEGVIPALDDRKLKPEKVVVEIQTMGKNIFMKVVGSNLYTVQASSLTTEEFAGTNLTSQKQMGVTRKNKTTGFESEIRIERETVMMTAFNDMEYRGKTVRVLLSGPCIRP